MNTIHRGFALEVIVQPDRFSAGLVAGEEIARAIRENPQTVLGLVSGRALIPLYKELVRMYREEGLDFSRVTVFHLDGDVGVDPAHPQSCRQIMWKSFFSLVNVNASNVHIPNVSVEGLDAFRIGYEKTIQDAYGIDLQIMDLQSAGQLAPTVLKKTSGCQMVTSADPVLNSRKCLMLASGLSAASAVADAVEGPIFNGSASLILKQHECARVILDEGAADELQLKDYYQWRSPRVAARRAPSVKAVDSICQSPYCFR